MPYRDAWEVKTPAIYLAYALPARIGGDLATAWMWVRVLDIIVAGLTAMALFRLAEGLLNRPAAWATSVWYLVIYAGSGHRNLAQAESWANLAVAVSLLLLWTCHDAKRISPRNGIALGFLTSLAFCFKPTCALPILAAALAAGWTASRRTGIRTIAWPRPVVALLLGALLPLLGFALWLSHNGALEAFLDIQRSFVAPYVAFAAAPFGSKAWFFWGRIYYQITVHWLPLILAAIGLGTARWRASGRSFVLAAVLGGFAAVWLQNRAFPYHWQAMLPALSILAGAGTSTLARAPRIRRLSLWIPLILLPLVWHMVMWGDRYWLAAQVATGHMNQTQWLEYLSSRRARPAMDQIMFTADYVAQHSAPDDRFLVWGFENELNVLANRRATTNYFLNPGLVSRFAPAKWKRQFLAQMTAQPPAFLAVVCDDDMRWLGAPRIAGSTSTSSYNLMQNWPEFHRLVETRYELVRSGFHLDLYRLRKSKGEGRS